MPLENVGRIEIPDAAGSAFDHGAFDPKTRRIFIAHTACDCVEVIDHDAGKHIATLSGFAGVAGAVADDGEILVTNRGSASAAWLDAASLETKAVFKTGARPNGAAIVKRAALGIVACIGDERESPTLQAFDLNDSKQAAIDLPGRPRWCVTDAAAERVFIDALQRAAAGRTTLIIAHRLTTARLADRIVVLDRGRIVEEGTHLELLACGGRYAHLYRLQMSPETETALISGTNNWV